MSKKDCLKFDKRLYTEKSLALTAAAFRAKQIIVHVWETEAYIEVEIENNDLQLLHEFENMVIMFENHHGDL